MGPAVGQPTPTSPDASATPDAGGAPAPEPTAAGETEPGDPTGTAPAAAARAGEKVLPRSPGDLDVGWGGPAEPDDDERILREVPPHWQ